MQTGCVTCFFYIACCFSHRIRFLSHSVRFFFSYKKGYKKIGLSRGVRGRGGYRVEKSVVVAVVVVVIVVVVVERMREEVSS